MIDVRVAQLRSFVAVAEALHFGHAAEELSLAQSAVSQHVRRLEREVGTALLQRSSRTVTLTPAGRRLLPAVRSTLRDLDRAVSETRAVAAGELGTIQVGAQQAARALVVPGVLSRLGAEVPGLTVEIVLATSAEGLALVQEGAIDVALVRDPTPREGLVVERLIADPIMVALPRGHRLAGRQTLELSELAGEPRIGWERSGAPDYHDRITGTLRAAGVDAEERLRLRGVDTRLGAVAAGLGYALESASYAWLFSDRVSFVPITGEPLTGEIVAVWPAVGAAPGLPAFLTAARGVAAQLRPDPAPATP